jgi:hypothetical protein
MPTYTVHLYQEMRLTFRDIEADSPEEAAEAATRAENPEIHCCEGRNSQAVVDLIEDGELVEDFDIVLDELLCLAAVFEVFKTVKCECAKTTGRE